MSNTLLSLLAGFAALASTSIDARPPADSNFRPLEFLVGHCWVGNFPGGTQSDEHCFEWVFDRKFIRDRHVVRGGEPYEGETLYRWDGKRQRIAFSYWNSAGELMEGTVEETPEGIVFPQTHETPAGTVTMKTIWTRPSDDSYRVWVGRREGNGWKRIWTMDLRRSR